MTSAFVKVDAKQDKFRKTYRLSTKKKPAEGGFTDKTFWLCSSAFPASRQIHCSSLRHKNSRIGREFLSKMRAAIDFRVKQSSFVCEIDAYPWAPYDSMMPLV
jgi:hypothetical protein